MKNLYLLALCFVATGLFAQDPIFDEEITIPAGFAPAEFVLPPSPLRTQVLFVGGHDIVQTTATYGNPAGRAIAKEWHDFIGFTPDETNESLGWVSVNHEQIYQDDKIGDGGGMTVFRVKRAANGDLEVVDQTLPDGRKGEFFNVDFVNTVGETGMNCAGISAPNGRIWTAEEWFASSVNSIFPGSYSGASGNASTPKNPGPSGNGYGVRDTAKFTINAPEFPVVDGMTIDKYENFNYMVEIDPKNAVAIRKQYNWGRAGWEGGAITEDGKCVYLGIDDTPAPFVKFVADEAWDFTKGTVYVYKQDAAQGQRWVAVPQTVDNIFGGLGAYAWSVGATMFDRNEWVAIDYTTGIVYWTETGRDDPGSRFANGVNAGGTVAAHHHANAVAQGLTEATDPAYWDYYGRVMYYDPATEEAGVMVEGGPYFASSPAEASYPSKHLSNPDGLSVITIDGHTFLMIQEDLNGNSYGRTPAGISNRLCELYLLSTEKRGSATVDDLIRITAIPAGAEVTGARQVDDNTIVVNSQHPNVDNPFPYNHSLTLAIHGFAEVGVTGINDPDFGDSDELIIFPNPTTREIILNQTIDFAIYDVNGKRLNVYRNTDRAAVDKLSSGTYFLVTADKTYKFLVQ